MRGGSISNWHSPRPGPRRYVVHLQQCGNRLIEKGGIAIEDAAALCALLPADTSWDEIPSRLALYTDLRDERAHKIQYFTRLAGDDLDDERRSKFNSTF